MLARSTGWVFGDGNRPELRSIEKALRSDTQLKITTNSSQEISRPNKTLTSYHFACFFLSKSYTCFHVIMSEGIMRGLVDELAGICR